MYIQFRDQCMMSLISLGLNVPSCKIGMIKALTVRVDVAVGKVNVFKVLRIEAGM